MTRAPIWPPIPDGDPPETRAIRDPQTGAWSPASASDPKSWHVGCMVSQARAIAVAKALFPNEITDGSNCRGEPGAHGALRPVIDPAGACLRCAEHNQMWTERVAQVRRALLCAFA